LPAIGLAVEILEYNYIPKSELDPYLTALGYSSELGAPADVQANIRLIKVASAGKVGGFANLEAGARYYLAGNPEVESLTGYDEIDSLLAESSQLTSELSEQTSDLAEILGDDSNPALQRSLTTVPPVAGSTQVIGIAKSRSELIIMPSLDYSSAADIDSDSVVTTNESGYVAPVAGSEVVEDIQNYLDSQTETTETTIEETTTITEPELPAISSDASEVDVEVIIGETAEVVSVDSGSTASAVEVNDEESN
jgi:hypothetical protein